MAVGNLKLDAPSESLQGEIFGNLNNIDGARVSMAVPLTVDLSTDADVHGFQNPFSVPCLVHTAVVVVTTSDASETIDVGVASNATTLANNLIHTLSVASAGGHGDLGTNGGLRLIDAKGGLNDYVTWKASAGTDTLAGTLTVFFTPLG